MGQLKSVPVVNENLFTKHYLEERVKNLSEWKEDEEIKEAFEEIKDLWEQEKDLVENYNEAQLEDNFIKKIFEILDHSYGIQETVRENALRPDYGFFESNKDRREAHEQKNIDDFYKTSIAIGDAKKWGISLDKKTKSGRVRYERSNPSWQIYVYLKETPARWGILTNGEKWRLYNEQTSDRLDTYYEVDLKAMLENDDRGEALQEFKYFYLFFRQTAFLPTKESFLDKVFEQSEKYSQKIGKNLEDSVYKSLLWMTKGYFDMGTNNLEKNKENVKKVHDNSLIFLYRLLFLLYAESKNMLGTEIPKKYESDWSFSRWVDDILEDIDNDQVNPKGGLYHYRLKSIFRLVREGSESIDGISSDEFYVPAYNGGLFSQEEYPFLNQKKIQDGHLARVVDLLVRAPSAKEGQRGRIDYSDLSLRHLGGIYEGLLEYKPELADEDMVAEKKKDILRWVPASESKKDFSEFDEDKRARKGELYLVTDKGERKATGSYYTPDYIVEYIVKNTLGPVIEEKLEDAETDEERRQAILSTNVLDPAMGSGHFLVEAIDFLASRLVEFAENGGEERDIDWAKRKVARNCIYGVDANPLATELAKVSLWLDTMAEDKPLSFLDHQLKTGNSLIGADIHGLDKHPEDEGEVTETGGEPGQMELSDFFGKDVRSNIKELLSVYSEMLDVVEERPEDIKEQEDLFQKFEDHPFKKKFDVLADVQTGYYFGNEFSKTQYENLLDAFRGSEGEWKEITSAEWVRKASDSVSEKGEDNLSDEKGFFHWKLEFPEVFFDIEEGTEKNNSGFDAVVGNPPYINANRLNQITDGEKSLWKQDFDSAKGAYDIYVLFLEESLKLCRDRGIVSMIVPNKHLSAPYAEAFREFIIDEHQIWKLCDVSQLDVFDDPSIYPVIPFFRSQKKFDLIDAIQVVKPTSKSTISDEENLTYCDSKNLTKVGNNLWGPLLLGVDSQEIFWRAIEDTKPLNSEGTVQASSTASEAEEFTVALSEGEPTEEKKKFVKTGGIDRFLSMWNSEEVRHQGEYYSKPVLNINHNVLTDLRRYQYDTKKLIFAKVASRLETFADKEAEHASVDTNLFYDSNNDIRYYASVLNSNLVLFIYSGMFGALRMRGGDFQFQAPQLSQIPVPSVSFSISDTERKRITETLWNEYKSYLKGGSIPQPNTDGVAQEFLAELADSMSRLKENRESLNLNLSDYLTNYSAGKKISDVYIPVSDLSETVLTDTKTDRDNLKLGRAEFEEDDGELILKASARYKPENEGSYDDLDRWGYTETELIPAMKFSGSKEELALIREFTKLAVDEAGGFANFREKATKTKSLIDRLEELTLPKLEDVESGLEKYLEQREKAERLEEEIQETDNLIDAIVFDLYDLNEGEIVTVLDSLETAEEVKQDILEKYGGLNE